jgi:tripartite-type tricarboxylate transporter receptor subunit TctC
MKPTHFLGMALVLVPLTAFGQAPVPRDLVGRYGAEARRALADPEVRGKLGSQGFDVVGSTPEAFLAFARAESDKWVKVIRDYNIRVE